MALTPDQLRAARALLNISQDDLAKGSGVAVTSIRQFELGVTTNLQQKTENALLSFLGQRIEFIGKRGVALREEGHLILDGSDAISQMFEDIREHLHGQEHAEVLFLCGDPCLLSPELAQLYTGLKEDGFFCRHICHHKDAPAPVRLVPSSFTPLALQAIYGSTVAQMVGHERILLVRSSMLAGSLRQTFELLWAAIPALNAEEEEAETTKLVRKKPLMA